MVIWVIITYPSHYPDHGKGLLSFNYNSTRTNVTCLRWAAWETAGIFYSSFMVIIAGKVVKVKVPTWLYLEKILESPACPGNDLNRLAGLCGNAPKCLFRAKFHIDISFRVATGSSPPLRLIRKSGIYFYLCAVIQGRCLGAWIWEKGYIRQKVYLQKCHASVWRSD